MGNRGMKPFDRHDDQIKKLEKIRVASGLSNLDFFNRCRVLGWSESISTLKNKMALTHGCTNKQFGIINTAVMEAHAERMKKMREVV